MKYYLLIFFLIATVIVYPQTHKLKITVIADSVSLNDNIYITGNNKEFGNWNPGTIKLNKDDDSTFTKEFTFNDSVSLEFKFTRGTWNTESLNDFKQTTGNIEVLMDKDYSLVYRIKYWKDKDITPIKSFITGEAVYHKDFKTPGLQNRDVIVLLPKSYKTDLSKRYPVLYVHDGQNAFDPATSSFGFDWRIDEVVDSLTKAGLMEEIIVVGIYCTSERFKEYSYDSLGKLYCNFLVNNLKPFIDNKYRTKPDRENTAVMGSSMGGLISFILLWEYDNIFSKAACLSPAFKIDVLDYVSNVSQYKGKKKDIFAYIDNGGVGLESALQPGIDDMLKELDIKGYKENTNYIWVKDTGAEHNEKAWSLRIYKPLQLFFKK